MALLSSFFSLLLNIEGRKISNVSSNLLTPSFNKFTTLYVNKSVVDHKNSLGASQVGKTPLLNKALFKTVVAKPSTLGTVGHELTRPFYLSTPLKLDTNAVTKLN